MDEMFWASLHVVVTKMVVMGPKKCGNIGEAAGKKLTKNCLCALVYHHGGGGGGGLKKKVKKPTLPGGHSYNGVES
jgi:hypothetical protein